MNKLYKIVLIIATIFTTHIAFAQTYATPELKQKAEKEQKDKLEWIKKNQKYKKQGGDPNAYIKENTKSTGKTC